MTPELYRLPASHQEVRALRKESLFYPLYLFFSGSSIVAQWFAASVHFHPALGDGYFLRPPFLSPLTSLLLSGLLLALACRSAYASRQAPSRRRLFYILIPFAGLCFYYSRHDRFYPPWYLFDWLVRLRSIPSLAPARRVVFVALALCGIASVIVFAALRSRLAATYSALADTHGSARWADELELESSGLLDPRPVVELPPGRHLFLGLWSRPRHPPASLLTREPTHVLVLAPTRSGKGVGIITPDLLLWDGPTLVLDIKGENFTNTAGYRRDVLGQTVFCIDPTSLSSAQFNPLYEVRKGPFEVRDVQNIADMLVDPDGSNRQRDHWEKTSAELLVCLLLHVLYAEETKTLARCSELLSIPGVPLETTLRRIMATPHLGQEPHPVVAHGAQALLNKSANEQSGVVSTARSFLSLYADPVIARITSRSDFRVRDLLTAKTSLFLAIRPSDLTRARPLVRLMLNQILRRLTEELPSSGASNLLLMLDEFPSLGMLPFFEHALAFLAGYGIRAVVIAQDLAQIRAAYGPNESIVSNCDHRVAFTPNRPETAEYVSKMLGSFTVHSNRYSETHSPGPRSGSETTAPNDSQRPLLDPAEVLRFPKDHCILFAPAQRPILALKLRYYEHPPLVDRTRIPPPPFQPSPLLAPERHDWVGLVAAPPPPPPLPRELSSRPERPPRPLRRS